MSGRSNRSRMPRLLYSEDKAAEKRWENEGGAMATSADAAARPTSELSANAGRVQREITRGLDDRQDALMAVTSSDGRPPSRRERIVGWHRLGVGAAIAVAGIASWIVVQRVSPMTVAVGLAFGLMLVAAASPVWVAALLRGREERAAREVACSERPSRGRRRFLRGILEGRHRSKE